MIDKQHRLKSSVEFRNVRNSGKVYKNPLVVIIAAPNALQISRIGFVTGRSVGGAVERNLVKRRLRACIRMQLSWLRKGWDIIVIARQPCGKAAFQQINDAVFALLQKAVLLDPVDRQL